MFDILVIGAGLAGSVAALHAHAQGAKVAIARDNWGATALSSGMLALAYSPALGPQATLQAHIHDMILHDRQHPYAALGLKCSMAYLQQGYNVLADVLQGSGLDIPVLHIDTPMQHYVSTLGALLPGVASFAPHTGFDGKGLWGILSIPGLSYFDADRIQHGIPYDMRIVQSDTAFAAPMVAARAFDDKAVLQALSTCIKPQLQGLNGLIVPPVLGLQAYHDNQTWLRDDLNMPVVEALAILPSVPGFRLQRCLDAALLRAGIHHIERVVDYTASNQRLVSVTCHNSSLCFANDYILATGRLHTQPTPMFDNLFPAGMVLPGISAADTATDGVALASAMAAADLCKSGVQTC